ncbi:uncharacterized protein PODANS_7_2300 [Podospora anserina S mat+]|uniref:Podospora anserina S mat+ genomic DNA chromosome 7, supercontig 1 n=1 Tax=Podospora anserina (strain S / ATCC MYA-4624 / DSM 980 / FGSC 10383) TaxID=515849 RepID=B2AVN5_PODAN|nr:uncharacterized protein PODANS_7_2300 [Podospora anserina S mat+]CAP68459.1 unnamed protein product [Podospora anserina S mat+]CDP31931.1 Putative protein of unknown function [Podospora anserina S mat+]
MRCLFGSPFPFFFSQPTNFLFQDFASYLFSNVSLLSFIYHVHPRATAQVEEPREDRAGVFEQQRTIGDTPSFFLPCLLFFFWISKCHYGSRGERDYFWRLESKDGKYTHTLHTKPVFSFLSSVLPSSFVGGESYLQRHPILIT